jgi:hypothetical protein
MLNRSKNNGLGVKENVILNNSRNNGRIIKKKNNMNQTENVNYETSIFNQKKNNNNNNDNNGNNANNNNNGKINLKNIFNNKQIKSTEEVKENNSSKSFFSSIGETLGFVAPTPPNASFTNNIKTNIKSECEGEDCDVFINSNRVSEIRTNLGNNFNNPKTRFKRARNTLNNLLGKEVNYSKKNRTGNLENIPQTGDMFTYLEKT